MAGLAGAEVDEVLDLLMTPCGRRHHHHHDRAHHAGGDALLGARHVSRCRQDHRASARRPRSWRTSGCRRPILALSLAINDLDAGYGAVKALRGVSLNVEAGETVALLGTNGNGKSTLMKCVAGLVRPQRGSMSLTIDGTAHDLTRLSAESHRRSRRGAGSRGAAAVSQADRVGKSDARRLPQGRPPRHRSQPRRWPSRHFRCSRSGRSSSPAPCRAGSSRCSPSLVR